jgi:hypothetical protein
MNENRQGIVDHIAARFNGEYREGVSQSCAADLAINSGILKAGRAAAFQYRGIPVARGSRAGSRLHFYGGALTHASKPVTKGRLKKLLALIH